MANKSCFVVMAIGEQEIGGQKLTYGDLRSKYDDLIKEAIQKARPNLDVTRADDVSLPGTITTDIITRIMHSDYVIADVTYPNPNVFYELGLRHACRAGTIIIKDKNGPQVPFDIAHLRHIEYENTTAGLKALSEQLNQYFNHFDREPSRPDNHFLEHAKLTHFDYPNYKPNVVTAPPEVQILEAFFESPELLNFFVQQQSGEPVNQAELMKALFSNPKVSKPIIEAMVGSGEFNLLDGLTGKGNK
ncbi:hypothetical protein QNE49_000378 [Vibrio fluvialis]|nr:hypothetical protein [Vibrio fluvialis]